MSPDQVNTSVGFAEVANELNRVHEILNLSVNVRNPSFGAKGNGWENDRDAIQKAIDFAKNLIATSTEPYRCTIFFPKGIYVVKGKPLDCTDANGICLQGEGNLYLNVMFRGQTGAQIVDFSGSSLSGASGISFITETSGGYAANSSTIALQFALNAQSNGSQKGGLNCFVRNCYFQLGDNETANGGLGTIGVLNVRSEEFSMSDCLIKANSPVIYSNKVNLTEIGASITVASQYTPLVQGNGSMGVIQMQAVSLQAYQRRQPALILLNTNSLNFNGYISRQGAIDAGINETAIALFGQNDNINFSGTIESYSRIARLYSANSGINIKAVMGLVNAPMTEVFNVTGATLRDSNITVKFNEALQINNGRYFLYHEPVNNGNSPANGNMSNCTFSCAAWAYNSLFISGNLLKQTGYAVFNTGQPFLKEGGWIKDLKSAPISLGTTTTGVNAITGKLFRFNKPNKTDTTINNGSFYSIRIKGVIIIGNSNNVDMCMASIEGNYVLTEAPTSMSYNSSGQAVTIFAKSSPNGNTDITSCVITSNSGVEPSNQVFYLTVNKTGVASGQAVRFIGDIAIMSDSEVNMATIFY